MVRRALAALALLAAVVAPAEGRLHRPYTHHAHAHRYSAGVEDTGYYTNVSGHSVHRPAHANGRQSGASAQCGDGTYSFSEHHRGTCSHHGGVSNWY